MTKILSYIWDAHHTWVLRVNVYMLSVGDPEVYRCSRRWDVLFATALRRQQLRGGREGEAG
ncbi:hypothetical protein E2C01_068369 [Portunus trituberculatus]|uniref:Uncharacterized protein n=1 Tax=Portunus trituberculatus TaxID=210409 RepID=A0A5B7HZV3_PORTR|nr:hypothetical protein [Portunus trituberculatus]